MNRVFAIAVGAAFLAAAGCGERAGAPAVTEETAAPEPVGVIASDALSDLTASPTGIDFWTHPNVSFNSLIIVASADGLASYNVEDGTEVSRVPGVSLSGVAVSYIGFGPLAAGIAAAFDETESAFQFYGVDNVSRLFLPLTGGPSIRGAVRGFCMGRAANSPDPTLFVVRRGEMTVFNVTPDMDGETAGVAISGEAGTPIPETATACAVDTAGVVYILTNDGEIYRVDSDSAFDEPFAVAFANDSYDIAFLGSRQTDSASSVNGQIAILDGETGIVELFDASDGRALGAARIDAADDIEAVTEATVMGASAANLGGLYRDGAIALGIAGENPTVRLIPANGVANALGVAPLPPANPRGETARAEETNDLVINPTAPIGE